MILSFLSKRITLLATFILALCRRALCCIKRRRRNSADSAPLMAIGIVSDGKVVNTQNWGSWEEPRLNPVEEKIKLYREQRSNFPVNQENEEQNVDFFLDMTPKITRQKKLLLQNKTEPDSKFNFSMAPDPAYKSNELEVWDESPSWEADAINDADVSDVLREQKRQEREKRKKIERVARPIAGLSS